MLTPKYLESIEFNKVVELYNKLNIDITADIIQRIAGMEELTSTTKNEMKILIQTNGVDVFNETLKKTSLLTADRKRALKKIFENMIKEDLQGYKQLYDYREQQFKLSEKQYRILNQSLKDTNKTLENLTNTVAFRSQQTYVEAVDRAYMQVVSGAFSYDSVINNIVQELANKGITLKDRLGRNVQLEVAVRRNVMAGIQHTANNINRDIEEQLGCNGYEVTAHIGARPSHAEEQGKQFAITEKDASKYGLGLWSDVEYLWEEYNCRHTYFGIILGISEPVYSNKELKKYKNATVEWNGKKIPYYEATQKQRQLENAIRKQKRTIQILEKAKQDTTMPRTKLRTIQKKLNNFCKETGLQKDYNRIKVALIKNENKIKETKCEDVTNNFTKIQKFTVKEQKYYKDAQGTKYFVDGKNVLLEPSDREKEVAEILGGIYGGQVNIIPRVNEPPNVKTPDYIINNEKFDLKQITGNGKNTLDNAIRKQEKQANNFIFDISKTKMDINEAIKQIQNIYNSEHRIWVNEIVLIKNNKIIKVFRRK